MDQEENVVLIEKLSAWFPGEEIRLTVPWEHSLWSKTYRVEVSSGEVAYLKGTPRRRLEAQVTAILHQVSPQSVPAVLVDDLLKDSDWRWFLLADAGDCEQEQIKPACAIRAARSLGALQRMACQDTLLSNALLQCRADGLQDTLVDACRWALRRTEGDAHRQFKDFLARVRRSDQYFAELANTLSVFPATIVHGDLWSGNYACSDGGVMFIDWGDALWGAGSISIAHMLANAAPDLDAHEDDIWAAYAEGWQRSISSDFIRASYVASAVSYMVISIEISKICDGAVDVIRGSMLPAIAWLEERVP